MTAEDWTKDSEKWTIEKSIALAQKYCEQLERSFGVDVVCQLFREIRNQQHDEEYHKRKFKDSLEFDISVRQNQIDEIIAHFSPKRLVPVCLLGV